MSSSHSCYNSAHNTPDESPLSAPLISIIDPPSAPGQLHLFMKVSIIDILGSYFLF